MSTKIRELNKILNENGYKIIRSNGHIIYSNGTHSIPVPNRKEIGGSLVAKILKQIKANNESGNNR